MRPFLHVTALVIMTFISAIAPSKAEMAKAEIAKVADAQKIISIGGSTTEIIYALGAGSRLIARDTTSIFPEQALKLPDVGYMRALSPEGVLSLNSEAILIQEGSGPAETLDVLQKAQIPVVMIKDQQTPQGILDKIDQIGTVIGKKAEADTLIAELQAKYDQILPELAKQTHKKKILFVLSMRGGRILAAGRNSSADQIITMAGGVNAIQHVEGFKQVSDEAVITAAPDIILMMSRTGDHRAQDSEILAHPTIAATPAGAGKKLIRMNGQYLLGFGPRTIHAAEDLYEKIYGEKIGQSQ